MSICCNPWTPGPDPAWQDAVMESEAFISSGNSSISTSRRARAGWNPEPRTDQFRYESFAYILPLAGYRNCKGQGYVPMLDLWALHFQTLCSNKNDNPVKTILHNHFSAMVNLHHWGFFDSPTRTTNHDRLTSLKPSPSFVFSTRSILFSIATGWSIRLNLRNFDFLPINYSSSIQLW